MIGACPPTTPPVIAAPASGEGGPLVPIAQPLSTKLNKEERRRQGKAEQEE
jgi:hypothetical protein